MATAVSIVRSHLGRRRPRAPIAAATRIVRERARDGALARGWQSCRLSASPAGASTNVERFVRRPDTRNNDRLRSGSVIYARPVPLSLAVVSHLRGRQRGVATIGWTLISHLQTTRVAGERLDGFEVATCGTRRHRRDKWRQMRFHASAKLVARSRMLAQTRSQSLSAVRSFV